MANTKLGNPCYYTSLILFVQAWDKYMSVDVSLSAPVLLIPVSEVSAQAFMINLGSISAQNMLLSPEEGVGMEAFGINLDSFKASR